MGCVSMKRLLVALMIAMSLLTAASPAHAGGKSFKCDTRHWHTYVGLEAPAVHWRWGDLKAHMHVCWDKSSGLVLHKKTTARIQVVPNSVSASWGTEWVTYHSSQGTYPDERHQNYADQRKVMGTFRNCEGVGPYRACGPTGHFTVVLTFRAPRLVAWEGGDRWLQLRRPGEPNGDVDDFDRKIRFYDTP